jgi:hypothetical protein
MRATVGSGKFELPPEQVLFPARLKGVGAKTIQPKDTTKKSFTKWDWTFEITGPGGASGEHAGFEGQEVHGETWPRITTQDEDTARNWFETLSGRQVDIGEDVDTDTVIGVPCLILLRHGETYTSRDGREFTRVEVEDVLPWESLTDTEPPF